MSDGAGFTIVFMWLVCSALVAIGASSRERSGFGWFFLAVLLSPVMAFLLLIAMRSPRTEFRLDEIERKISAKVEPLPVIRESVPVRVKRSLSEVAAEVDAERRRFKIGD